MQLLISAGIPKDWIGNYMPKFEATGIPPPPEKKKKKKKSKIS